MSSERRRASNSGVLGLESRSFGGMLLRDWVAITHLSLYAYRVSGARSPGDRQSRLSPVILNPNTQYLS